MKRAYCADTIKKFLDSDPDRIFGALSRYSEFVLEHTRKEAWLSQINLLKDDLAGFGGKIYFEYFISPGWAGELMLY